MLGSVADAEDVVQDAFLRWLDVDRNAVREPGAFLRRVVTRLCLDPVRRGRETYVGPWLPEPVVESGEDELDDDVTLPLLMALERLSPLERAAFLLHDVFGLDFEEVAATIAREPAGCRQLATAPGPCRAARPRYPVPRERGLEIAEAFFAASRDGDMERLRALLAADVTVYADGGGKVPAGRAGRRARRRHAAVRDVRADLRREQVSSRALCLDQRPAGVRHHRAGRHSPDDRAGDRA